jgi:hypothetical protein
MPEAQVILANQAQEISPRCFRRRRTNWESKLFLTCKRGNSLLSRVLCFELTAMMREEQDSHNTLQLS